MLCRPIYERGGIDQSKAFLIARIAVSMSCFCHKKILGPPMSESDILLHTRTDTSNWLQPKKEDKAGFNPVSHFLSLGYRNAPAAAAAAP